jgi:hypothetical protein
MGDTDIVIILGALVLHKHLQTLFPDNGLLVTAASMPLLGLGVFPFLTLLLRLVCFTAHFRFAVVPNDGHSLLRVAQMTNLLCKARVELQAWKWTWQSARQSKRFDNSFMEIKSVSNTFYDRHIHDQHRIELNQMGYRAHL